MVVVDDAISAGSAVRGTYADLVACGAQPVAMGALVVFGNAIDPFATEKGITVEAIARLAFGLWPPAECPLCQAQMPSEKVSDAL